MTSTIVLIYCPSIESCWEKAWLQPTALTALKSLLFEGSRETFWSDLFSGFCSCEKVPDSPLARVGIADTEIPCTCSLSSSEMPAAVSAGEQGEGSPKGSRAGMQRERGSGWEHQHTTWPRLCNNHGLLNSLTRGMKGRSLMRFWYATLDSFLSIEPAIIGSYLFTFGGWSHKTTKSCHTMRISSMQQVYLLTGSQLTCVPAAMAVRNF